MGTSKANLSYDHPAQVETLGVRSTVGTIALFSNLVCPWDVSTEQDEDGC